MMNRDLIPAQVRAQALVDVAAGLGRDLVHVSYQTYGGGIYSEGVTQQIAEARRLLDFIEAAMAGEEPVTALPKTEAA